VPREHTNPPRAARHQIPRWAQRLTTRVAPAAAADGVPAPLIYPDSANAPATPAAAPARPPAPGAALHVQPAGVVVGRNDTLDRIFRRMALDTADLEAIRHLPGIRQSIDFLKPGESIKLSHSDGEILAAEFVNEGNVYRAVRFLSDAGVTGYYTPQGRPMRKALLRGPVEFTRVSSAFNPHRLHPILNRIRGHMGTDYAAPAGTPVHAAGDGHVSFAGRRGGYGNALMLAHSASVATLYGHLSRFAPHIRVGSRVQQGEVIGYVGMAGLATKPGVNAPRDAAANLGQNPSDSPARLSAN
jgi:murein DD-endopeptidase MepM/ murein hydrolase activator NlpD